MLRLGGCSRTWDSPEASFYSPKNCERRYVSPKLTPQVTNANAPELKTAEWPTRGISACNINALVDSTRHLFGGWLYLLRSAGRTPTIAHMRLAECDVQPGNKQTKHLTLATMRPRENLSCSEVEHAQSTFLTHSQQSNRHRSARGE